MAERLNADNIGSPRAYMRFSEIRKWLVAEVLTHAVYWYTTQHPSRAHNPF